MAEFSVDLDNDQLTQLARLHNDLVISQRQNEIIKVEMDKLRKENMILEGMLKNVEKVERTSVIKNSTESTSKTISPSTTVSTLLYPDLLIKYNNLVQSHESLLQTRRSDRIAWEALKTKMEDKIHRLRSGRKRAGGSEVKTEEKERVVVDAEEEEEEEEEEDRDVKMDDEVTPVDHQVKVTTGTSTSYAPPITSKAPSPLSPTSKHNTPIKLKTCTQQSANISPLKQPIFYDVEMEEEEKETQTLPASDHAEFESLNLLQSLIIPEAKQEEKDGGVVKMLGGPELDRGELRSRSSQSQHQNLIDRSRILVEESQENITPIRRDRSATRSKQSVTEVKFTTSKPRLGGPVTKYPIRDDQPRTPFAFSGMKPPPKIAVSDPPRTSMSSHINVPSIQKSISEPRPVKWLGRGVNGVTSTTHPTSDNKRPYSRRDSFEDDLPFPSRNGEVDTPTNKKARNETANSPLKNALVASPSGDKILNGLQGQEKVKHLRELARKNGSERSKVYATYKGRGRYSDSKPIEPEKRSFRDKYEIDPSKNNGHSYAYHDVVRKKECRKHLQGEDCEECKNWYQYTSDLPKHNQAPPFRQPITGEMPPENDEERHVQAHKNEVSRHRAVHARNPTPPGYWNLGFPSTPQVAEENAEADRMHRDKQQRLRQEAERGDGRYRMRR